jgi:hypothetical protein
MSLSSSVANYGGKQPSNTQNIKQFVVSSTTSQSDWIFSKKSGTKSITPVTNKMSVVIDNDLYVTGNIFNPSDINYKENIEQIKISKIINLEPVKYNLKTDYKKKTHYGFIAQDVEKFYPELVNTNNLGYKSVDYIQMIPLLLLKIKNMQTEIDELRGQIGSI